MKPIARQPRRRLGPGGGALLVLLSVVAFRTGSTALAQETPRGKFAVPELTRVPSDVRDTAGLFSSEATEASRKALQNLERKSGVATLIETIETLRGENIDEAAVRLARRSGVQGVFILIAKRESKIEVLASRKYLEALNRPARTAIRAGFLESFRKEEFDEGLRKGVAAVESAVTAAQRDGKLPKLDASVRSDEAKADRPTLPGPRSPGPGATPSPAESALFRNVGRVPPLVVRNQVRLTLGGARAIITAATQKAESMNLKVNIAVVDDGGHLLSFDRMDGARPASGYTSLTKAVTAATFRQPSGPVPPGSNNPDPLLNLSLQNAALASGGKLTTLYGGVPVVVDGQVIGGVGVGGGTGEQDAQIARAGIQGLLDQIARQNEPGKASDEPARATAKPAAATDKPAVEEKKPDGSF